MPRKETNLNIQDKNDDDDIDSLDFEDEGNKK